MTAAAVAPRVAVLGAGAWGTALATAMPRAGLATTLWTRREEHARALAADRENRDYLPGVALDPAIAVTADLVATVAGAEAALVVVPAQHLRPLATTLAALPPLPLVICCKGIEETSGLLPTGVLADLLPGYPLAVLSGPTFAVDVAADRPAAATLAARDEALARRLAGLLGSRRLRLYWSTDVTGVEVGGALKNVIAIAAGIAQGRGFGESARAALLTRGLAEMARLAAALGGRPDTLMGLSGVGDLMLTGSAMQSRNFSLGHALGQGERLSDLMARRRTVAEGVWTARAVTALAARHGVELPIAAAVDAVLHGGADLENVLSDLLSRPMRGER